MSAPRALRSRRGALCAVWAVEGGLILSVGYLLTLLLAAGDQRRRMRGGPSRSGSGRTRFAVLVPAHDEQTGILATLDSLAACEYPCEQRRTVVIADNCSDRTAELSREAGVEVWERSSDDRRGKGFALIWALRHLLAEPDRFDAVVIVDADCAVSPNMLSVLDGHLQDGANVVQVRYEVQNPDASSVSALRFAAFTLMDTVRPMGKERLGLSCGLFGTGMAFSRKLLDIEPWTATGLVEDFEYHMRLVEAGERAHFAADAWVSSPMPTSFEGGSDQQARWEQGRLQTIRRWSPRLLASGIARRDIVRLHAALEHMVPPQSLIAAGGAASVLGGALLGSRRLLALALTILAAQVLFVLSGLRLAEAPAGVYRSLLLAPALIVRKLVLYSGLLIGRGPSAWIRTPRS